MSNLSWLGLLLVSPVMLILGGLGWWSRPQAQRRAMLVWSLSALVVALLCCCFGIALAPSGPHQLWPQVAAAALAFIGFVSVWGLGLWWTRPRGETVSTGD